jgi:hypothetical protein
VSKNDKVTKPIVLDLDAIGNDSPKLSVVLDAQKRSEQQAKDALTYFASADFAKVISDANATSAKVFADLAKMLDTSRVVADMFRADFAQINAAKLTLQTAIPDFTVFNKQMLASVQPLYDLRLVANAALADFSRQFDLLKNYTIDISTLFGSLKISNTTQFTFKDTTLSPNQDNVGLQATAVQSRSNQFVVQERTTKVDLLLSTTKEQHTTLLRLESDVVGIKQLVGQLVKQGQQRFTIKDVQYDPESYYLKIGNHRIEVKARRERQLCELLLSTLETMQKHWDIEEMLELIGEASVTPMSRYKQWTDWYYHAALRLNKRLEQILGMRLIIVDGKTQSLYINPAFYHN